MVRRGAGALLLREGPARGETDFECADDAPYVARVDATRRLRVERRQPRVQRLSPTLTRLSL